MLLKFLQWTAWAMEKPVAYGAFHLTFFFVGLALSLLGAYLLRNAGERANRAVLLTVGLVLLVSEVYKQLFYTYILGKGTYQWWIFPFQLCSVPMYFCLFLPFLKEGKLRQCCFDFLLAFNLMGGFLAFIEPSGLVHEYWTLTLHAFSWHMLLVFVGLYLGFSGRAGRKLRDFRNAVVVFILCCAVAFAINLALRQVSGGAVNMFYVGPSDSPIIVFRDISARFGWYVNTPIYMACLCAAAFVFYFPFCLWNKRRQSSLQSAAVSGSSR